MKTILLSVLVMFFFCGCSTYQYLTLDADHATKTAAKELVWENDTLKLIFNFNGQWGNLKMTVFNKSVQPIAVNWQKSAIVFQDSSYSLFNPSARLTGDIQKNLLDFRPAENNTQRLAEIDATLSMPNSFTFLPPQAHSTQQDFQITKSLPSIPALPANIPVQKMTNMAYSLKFRKAVYDLSSTPLKFRLFLSYDVANGQQFFTQHLFYVTEVKQTNESGPYQELINADGDKFYCKVRLQ